MTADYSARSPNQFLPRTGGEKRRCGLSPSPAPGEERRVSGGVGAVRFSCIDGRDERFFTVIPAKAGIHLFRNVSHEVDPGFRRGDDKGFKQDVEAGERPPA
jgi:hypothetical protein